MLGVCCHWLEERTKPKGKVELVNAMDERILQLGRYRDSKYSPEAIKATYVNNASNLAKMLPKIAASGVRLFRISSALFPLADQVDHSLWDNKEVRDQLKIAGDFVKQNNMRVTTHPGQFCVLSSDSDKVVENAIADLAIHAWLFDMMGLEHSPFYAINIHGGKSDRIPRLIERIKLLPDNIRNRLTLENDETAYSLVDLLEVHRDTGVPLVWDSHHHVFNDGDISMEDAMMLATETWRGGIKPLQHISNTEPYLQNGSFTDRRKHSDMIHYVPEPQLSALRENIVDCDVEAKMKNISVLKMSKDFGIPL
jgi:UV DNA damage endonuclease